MSPAKNTAQADFLVDPVALRILLVDANSASGAKLSDLLQRCSYQVTACNTSQQAIQILKEQDAEEGKAGFDLILKEHCPSNGSNACRLLKKAQTEPALQGIPIIVASTTEDRDVMVNCLQLGAADYMMKPLRLNELRNLWARVYWWRRASYLQQQSSGSNTPQAVSLSQLSGSSLETIRENQEAQEGNLGERSAEGSAPNVNGSNENGSRCLGSKNGSKDCHVGWSGNQTKLGSGHGRGTSGEGLGNSASKPCMASNHPSSADGAACLLDLRKQVSETSQKSKQDRSSLETDTAVDATPFRSPEAQKHGITGRQPARKERSDEAVPAEAPSGFRAYRSKDTRKRSSDSLEGEGAQKHSCSSARTHSLEAPQQKLRRTELRQPNQSLDVNERCSRPPLPSPATAGATAGEAAARGAGPSTNSQGAPHIPADSSQTQVNLSAYYPFGVMPNPFTMAQVWSQFGPRPSDNDMAQFFAQQGQLSGQAAAMCSGQQQQQQMLHNQLMLQHNLMMLHSLPGNPFACFPGFDNATANQVANLQHSASQCSAPPAVLRPQPESALPSIQQAMNSTRSRPWEAQSQAQRPQTDRQQTQNTAAEQSLPSSGRRVDAGAATELGTRTEAGGVNGTMTGTATGNTLGAGNSGNATGATSHATAQVGLDGCLMEPSQQERRAQALHKYKQKRKNLCFTKKIRYESRKQLAQARPRVKGQFVRVGDIADAVDALTEARKDSDGAPAGAGTTVSTYVAGKRDGEIQMIKLPGQSGREHLKDAQVYDDTESDEENGEATHSISPASLAQQSAITGAAANANAGQVDVSKSLTMPIQACEV